MAMLKPRVIISIAVGGVIMSVIQIVVFSVYQMAFFGVCFGLASCVLSVLLIVFGVCDRHKPFQKVEGQEVDRNEQTDRNVSPSDDESVYGPIVNKRNRNKKVLYYMSFCIFWIAMAVQIILSLARVVTLM
jgi:hypothetical protein